MRKDIVTDSQRRKSKKELLFAAALGLIGERGYGGTSVDEIAARAGVAKGVVYYYFDSKAALAEQLIRTGLEFLAERLQRAADGADGPEKAIIALAREEMRQLDKRRDFAKFLLSEMWREDREWQEVLDQSVSNIVRIFVIEIEKGQKLGVFRPDIEVGFTAQTIFTTFLAGALNYTVIHPDKDPVNLADALADFALAGLYTRPLSNTNLSTAEISTHDAGAHTSAPKE